MTAASGQGMRTHSQLLLEALDLRLHCISVLRLPLAGRVAGVGQLGQATQSLLQPLHIRQQLRDLKHQDTNTLISPTKMNKSDPCKQQQLFNYVSMVILCCD